MVKILLLRGGIGSRICLLLEIANCVL